MQSLLGYIIAMLSNQYGKSNWVDKMIIWSIYLWNRIPYAGKTEATWSYTEMEMLSFWQKFHHWPHWKLSFWQLSVQPVAKILSKWQHFHYSVNSNFSIMGSQIESPGTNMGPTWVLSAPDGPHVGPMNHAFRVGKSEMGPDFPRHN